jgi:NAD(P)-dependent dehydrogenase (short-subunit alcohol dehydrogenase family)
MTIHAQQQAYPGLSIKMEPVPDHGEKSYEGSGKLTGRAAIITGGDSGIGKAVAIAFAREGADVLISYLPEEQPDAEDTRHWVEAAGRRCVLLPGDLTDPSYCRSLVDEAVGAFGRLDIVVNNAAYQVWHDKFEDFTFEEWRHTFAVNIDAMFLISQAALPHLKPGSSIINSTSINSNHPVPMLVSYAATKAAIVNFTQSTAALLAPRGIRVNSVAPGPIWTPLIPATMPREQIEGFAEESPMGRPGQPAELAATYVLLASDQSGFTTGSRFVVAGGLPVLSG